jgi:hypothetical protein
MLPYAYHVSYTVPSAQRYSVTEYLPFNTIKLFEGTDIYSILPRSLSPLIMAFLQLIRRHDEKLVLSSLRALRI